jgi:Trk K+ transport system NAD-binding subunit
VSHIQRKLDIEQIVVRVNESKNLKAFANLGVELVDVDSIVSSGVVKRLDSLTDTQ